MSGLPATAITTEARRRRGTALLELEELTRCVIGGGVRVHRALGPGLLESIYQECLTIELRALGLSVRREVAIPIVYRSMRVRAAYRIDLLIDDRLVVEVKAVIALGPIHRAQLLTYLKLTGHKVGLMLNFNVPVLRDGIMRVVL